MSDDDLEPAARMEECQNCGVIDLVYALHPNDSTTNIASCEESELEKVPLVRLSDVIAIIEGHRDRYEERRKKAFDSYMEAESEKNRRVHQSVAAQNQDRVETLEKILEDFTQNGGTE